MDSLFDCGRNDYGRVILTPSTVARTAASPGIWREILAFHGALASDTYVRYVDAFYRECVRRYGEHWFYLDIVNVVYTAARLLRPKNYLEIGVRRGRSLCVAARGNPDVAITAFDAWMADYDGMPNPGPDFVRDQLRQHGHRGACTFVDGDTHATLLPFFEERPEAVFDLITVDGDHSERGALADLRQVVPHLALGGMLVFDDVNHPRHPYLLDVWRAVLSEHACLAGYEYTEQGFGVAFAIRNK
ncbi:MAG: class I SAM-dependent methyltransferase [Kiritimatiellae bacterium]|nr:class I SAM-dependent methyltransferase [Kiritimatiellia bacterium]